MSPDTNTCGRWPQAEGIPFPSQSNPMIVICKSGRTELIKAPQDPYTAWEIAERLTRETGILHWVGRV